MGKWTKRILHKIFEAMGIIFDIWQLIILLGGGGMTATGANTLQSIPIIYPILLLIIGVGLIVFRIIRTITKYRAWGNTNKHPVIEAIMNTELEYYECLLKIADKVEKRNRKKDVDSKTRKEIVQEYAKMIGFTTEEKINQVLSLEYLNSGKYSKREQKKFDKLFNLDPHDYHQRLAFLLNFAQMLNRAGLGLKEEMGNTPECEEISKKLHRQQLQLEVSGKEIHIVDDLKDFVYSAFSVAVALRLINRNRIWYKKIPLALINMKDSVNDDAKAKYDEFHVYVRKQLRKYVMENGVSLE